MDSMNLNLSTTHTRNNNNELKDKKIASFNVRTLKIQENIFELENALKNKNADILGVSEVIRNGEEILKTKEDNVVCYKGNNVSQVRGGIFN